MSKNERKKDSDPKPPAPVPPPPPVPTVPTARHGSASQIIPDLQSVISGMSRMSATSMHSLMSGGDNPHDIEANAPHEHHRHHHIPHPTLEGLEDMFKRRDKSSQPKDDGTISPRGPAKIHAPRTLVITLDSKLEDKFEAYGVVLRKRLQDMETEDLGDEIIAKQLHDLQEMEWMLDDESKLLLRKHVLFWTSALAMTRRKIKTKDTAIPVTATYDFYKPMTRCERYNRICKRACCSRHRRSLTEDLLGKNSLQKFDAKENDLHSSPSMTDNAKSLLRREHIFDEQVPTYSSLASYTALPPK